MGLRLDTGMSGPITTRAPQVYQSGRTSYRANSSLKRFWYVFWGLNPTVNPCRIPLWIFSRGRAAVSQRLAGCVLIPRAKNGVRTSMEGSLGP
jgi:hypothetical protein